MTDTTAESLDYKDTLFLPKTDFPMRAGLPQREPDWLARWERLRIYHRLRETAHGVVDDALAKLGRTRSLALTTPRFLVVPFLVRAAPVITTMHARLATYFADALGLTVSPAPMALEEVAVSMLWHASYDDDPAHRWLRQVLVRLAGEAGGVERL